MKQTELTIKVKDAETKLWIQAPQIETLGLKGGKLILRATFPLGSLYGDKALLTKKARIFRNGKKHSTHWFSPIRVDPRVTSLMLTLDYEPTQKELVRLKRRRLPQYTGFVHGQGTPQKIDWKEAELYR